MGENRSIPTIIVLAMAMSVLSGCLEEESSTDAAATGSGGSSTGNSAPKISGNPENQIMATDTYSFTPTASDADGDSLSFSISGKPGWATFSASSGRLSGAPQSADVGTYSNITITVRDASASASLGPFSIIVSEAVFGTVTLSWTAPTQNEDGSTLTDLDGYRLYWGKTPGNYTNSVTIDNESITTYVVDNILVGTYEFVGTSFNTAGVESRYSNPATKVVQQ